ncbi:ribosomal protein S18 acetylase RimI-like enzyme [Kribbella steppae]|uniref:Ribosomal protein S18 acetylase RimI-like enzyme n=1 Tax=Kribbella steppae TaxID=2512223 RepID=A0A4R2GVZ2_9ACTN|nr:GNAT family N-acetyltransferase [Kribbella steppae]TCO14336.1 ribosomal protein S18 acetylase RimI-like enzyme [Kribbella steppae]
MPVLTAGVVLPDHYTVRPPEPTDAKALFELLSDYNTSVIGFADCRLDEVADCLVEPGFDRAADGWLVLDAGNGGPAGYGTAFAKGDWQVIELEVTAQDPAVADWLIKRTLRRAGEMGRERGHAEVTVDCCIFGADEPMRALLSDHDFTVGTTYHRMRIDHAGDVAAPDVPEGVVVRRGTFDDASRWAAHEAIIDSFQGQFGFVARPHDEWVEALDARVGFDWSDITVLEVDGRAVAVRVCSDMFVEGEDCGYIGTLGVVEEFRGRGLARFLLRDAFARDAAAGLAGTILNVDTNNPTPALGLYLSVGMKPTLVFEGWRRILPIA